MRKYINFINESRFLKNTNLVGFLEKDFYSGIERILSNCDETSFIEDEKYLLWDFENFSTTSKINEFTFRTECENVFDLQYLKFTREPIEVGAFNFKDFVNERVNHYMIKSNNSDVLFFGELDYSDEIKSFVDKCNKEAKKLGLNTRQRYCYLTIDQKSVEGGQSQREFGWHIDGLQGAEVGEKKPADYQFIWCDDTPTKFCTQTFDISGADVSIHNIFNWLSRQVQEKSCYLLDKEKIYLMNAYHVHTATKAETATYRKFVRLSYTNTPITSTKMTINPQINYNYKIHITSGNIPKNLL